METHSVNMGWPNYGAIAAKEHYGDLLSFPTQLPPLDHFSSCCGYAAWDFQPEFGFQVADFRHLSLLDMFLCDPLYTSLDYAPDFSLLPEGIICHSVSEFGVWNEKTEGFDSHHYHHQQQQQLQIGNRNTEKMLIFEQELPAENKKSNKRSKKSTIENNGTDSKRILSRKTISQYFYMPITQAAREMNVGLTFLKKRCRELGIRRWPRRKLMSLQTLIKNVQEDGEEKMREAIRILEQEKKLMEEIPNMDLRDKTKRLRQACFKANYKKRKLMGVMESASTSCNHAIVDEKTQNCCGFMEEDDHDEEFKSFFSDFFLSYSSSDVLL